MRLGLEFSAQQRQKPVLAPHLRQALTILQLPALELAQYVHQQMLENPWLEVGEEGQERQEGQVGEVGEKGEVGGVGEVEGVEAVEEVGGVGEAPDVAQDLVLSGQWLDPPRPAADPPAPAFPEGEAGGDGAASLTNPEPTLYEHLHDQLRYLGLSPQVRAAAEFLIDSLDENGYLTLDLREASAASGQPLAVLEEALRAVQGLDPAGVGARSLQECLLLQWEAVGDGNPLVPALIRDHLRDLAAGRLARIAAALGVTPAEVQGAADALRGLDPKPGRRFRTPASVPYVFPDVVVERVGPDFVVLVNEAPGSRPVLSPAYRDLMTARAGLDSETRRFLERKLRSALWLLRSIEQRRLTLLRVAETIVQLQRPFFERGPRHLRPLTLRQVAGELGLHESTVSRAIAGKYMQSPCGLFQLKYFFSSGVESEEGRVSAETVKRLIASLVAAEDPCEPLSDKDIADTLARQGIRISRRTVAKYRDEAGIPSAARRRRY